jgi:hypothetical protein
LDPQFVDTALHDYHLRPESPCIGAGRYGRDCGALPFVASSIADGIIPAKFLMVETYPNPFNGDIRIKYVLLLSAEVQLEIYNVLGRKVISLENGYVNSGSYNINFEPEQELSSGIYLVRFSADNQTAYRKITYLK